MEDVFRSINEFSIPQPLLTKAISNSIVNQQDDPTCFAHVASKVLLKFFKTYHFDQLFFPGKTETSKINETNNKCDDLYLNPLQFCNMSNMLCDSAKQLDILSI